MLPTTRFWVLAISPVVAAVMPITDLSVFLLLAISLDGLVGVVLVRELGQTLSTRREGVRLPQQHRRC